MPGLVVSLQGRKRVYFEKFLVVRLSSLRIHRYRLMKSVGYLLRVPRVDDDASIQALRGTCEFGDDHYTLALLLRRDELIRHLGIKQVRIPGLTGLDERYCLPSSYHHEYLRPGRHHSPHTRQ